MGIRIGFWCRVGCLGWLLSVGGGSTGFCQDEQPLPAPLETPAARASYGIGRQIIGDLSQGGLEGELLDVEALMMGIRDAIGNKPPQIAEEDYQQAMLKVQQAAQQRVAARMAEMAKKNCAAGEKFLAEYKRGEGVQSLAKGVLYKVLKSGKGATPKAGDIVTTHYQGRLIDGTEFDSSYKRNEPAVFPVDKVIEGWTLALMSMKVGDKWELVIPSDAAYGEDGRPGAIEPNSVLIFDIELLGIGEEGAADEGQPKIKARAAKPKAAK